MVVLLFGLCTAAAAFVGWPMIKDRFDTGIIVPHTDPREYRAGNRNRTGFDPSPDPGGFPGGFPDGGRRDQRDQIDYAHRGQGPRPHVDPSDPGTIGDRRGERRDVRPDNLDRLDPSWGEARADDDDLPRMPGGARGDGRGDARGRPGCWGTRERRFVDPSLCERELRREMGRR